MMALSQEASDRALETKFKAVQKEIALGAEEFVNSRTRASVSTSSTDLKINAEEATARFALHVRGSEAGKYFRVTLQGNAVQVRDMDALNPHPSDADRNPVGYVFHSAAEALAYITEAIETKFSGTAQNLASARRDQTFVRHAVDWRPRIHLSAKSSSG